MSERGKRLICQELPWILNLVFIVLGYEYPSRLYVITPARINSLKGRELEDSNKKLLSIR